MLFLLFEDTSWIWNLRDFKFNFKHVSLRQHRLVVLFGEVYDHIKAQIKIIVISIHNHLLFNFIIFEVQSDFK